MNSPRRPPRVIDVVAGRPELLIWDAKARELQLEALPTLRASAERWAGSLTAVLGAVSLAALLKGTEVFADLSQEAAAAGKGLFFAAAGLALIAMILAGIAAQEVSSKVLYPESGDALRTASDSKIAGVRKQLAWSRWLAAGSVLASLGAAAVLYWGTAAESKPVTISITNCEAFDTSDVTPVEDAAYRITCE